MRKIRLLFKIDYVYHKAAFDPVIELLLSHDKYDVWFSLTRETKRFFIFDFPFRSHIIKEWERLGYRFTNTTAGFDIVITGDTLTNSQVYGKTLVCFLNHGTGIKNILYRNLARVPHDKYQIFVEGEHRVQALRRTPGLGKNEVHLIGLPKLDFYFQGRYRDREAILQPLGLDPRRQTVLYAPTYKPTSLYHLKDAIFEQTRDFNLIVKLHPYSWMGKYASHRQHRLYERRAPKYPHAVLLPFDAYNILPYYAVTDTLISEASSTVFDFLALQKFGIIYDLPCERLQHSDGAPLLEIDNRAFLAGAFVHMRAGDQLAQAIDQALHPTAAMHCQADIYRQHLFYQLDGRAAHRFVEKMEQLYAEGGHENVP